MNDTIAAIATALANKALSIIRVSGPDAIDIVNKIFVGKDLRKVKSHTINYGRIKVDNRYLDEVLVSVFKAPNTFTTEDVVEVNCHGGIYVTNAILEQILLHGARLAEPGEFTKRAFLNGRIDLTQAEAIMDIIESNTANSLQMANNGLTGKTKEIVEDFKQRVLHLIAKIEVNIDYPEYEDEEQMTHEVLKPIILDLLKDMDVILKKAEVAQIIKYGIKTAIVGKPNVGKSSLLNAMLKEDKAIVTNIAGTTRDIVEGQIDIGGIVLNLIDTAGVRMTEDIVEKIGVEKTKQVLEQADLVILVFDNSTKLDQNDYELLSITRNKNRIIVINKRDLPQQIKLDEFDDYIMISSFDDDDIEKLESKIKEVFNVLNINTLDPTYIGNTRQIAKLKMAKASLESALNGINLGLPVDIINIDINNAWISLGEILGEVSSDDLLDELFANFCLGK